MVQKHPESKAPTEVIASLAQSPPLAVMVLEAKVMATVLTAAAEAVGQGNSGPRQEAWERLVRRDRGMMAVIIVPVDLAQAVVVLGRRVVTQITRRVVLAVREQAVQSAAVLWGMLAVAAVEVTMDQAEPRLMAVVLAATHLLTAQTGQPIEVVVVAVVVVEASQRPMEASEAMAALAW